MHSDLIRFLSKIKQKVNFLLFSVEFMIRYQTFLDSHKYSKYDAFVNALKKKINCELVKTKNKHFSFLNETQEIDQYSIFGFSRELLASGITEKHKLDIQTASSFSSFLNTIFSKQKNKIDGKFLKLISLLKESKLDLKGKVLIGRFGENKNKSLCVFGNSFCFNFFETFYRKLLRQIESNH